MPLNGQPIVNTPPDEEREKEELREQVRALFAEVLEMDKADISDTAHFIDDLGGDSLQSISLSIFLEEKFDLLIPNEAFLSCFCVNDVARLIYDLQHGLTEQAEEVRPEQVKMITRFEDTPR